MSDPTSPPPPPAEPPAGGGSGAAPPPPPPPSAAPKETNTVMIVLAYLWILALVPLLVEKDDKEIQWHAKHGIVLVAAEIVFWIILSVLMNIPVLGVVGCAVFPIAWLAILVVHILCIVKALKGEKLIIPGLSQYADRF